MLKKELKKRIKINDLENYSEKRNRVFKISYIEPDDRIRLYKCFQRKDNLKKYLDKYNISDICVCDVVYYEQGNEL